MGTIVGRTRKDGSRAFTAQIVIKVGGKTVHREAQTFDRKPAANAWIVKREHVREFQILVCLHFKMLAATRFA
jgi:hypothetical protein